MSENTFTFHLSLFWWEKKNLTNDRSFDWNFLPEYSPNDNMVVVVIRMWERKKGLCKFIIISQNVFKFSVNILMSC